MSVSWVRARAAKRAVDVASPLMCMSVAGAQHAVLVTVVLVTKAAPLCCSASSRVHIARLGNRWC